jgi:hypothetical protein
LEILFVLVIVYSFFKNKTFIQPMEKKIGIHVCKRLILSVGAAISKKNKWNNSGESQTSLFYVTLQGRFQFREEPTVFVFKRKVTMNRIVKIIKIG